MSFVPFYTHHFSCVLSRILWGLKKDGDEWSGGKILDPENGKSYKCWIQVIDDGRRLKVRGYIGISLLGRTQYWKKAKD